MSKQNYSTPAKKIKILLLEHDIRQVDIARALGVSRVAICNVISGKRRSRKIEAYIARKLGVSWWHLFGGQN